MEATTDGDGQGAEADNDQETGEEATTGGDLEGAEADGDQDTDEEAIDAIAECKEQLIEEMKKLRIY